jgi:four helix bundle protein
MAKANFERLRVYQLAEKLADAVWDIVVKWERFPRNTMGEQLVDAADSVGANIAEGAGRGSFQDNRRFVRYARASLNETQYWLRRAFRRSLLTEAEVQKLRPLVEELGPRLNAYLRSIGPVVVQGETAQSTDTGLQKTTDN